VERQSELLRQAAGRFRPKEIEMPSIPGPRSLSAALGTPPDAPRGRGPWEAMF